MIRTIVLNGPKGSGKDVIADYLVNKYNTAKIPVYKIAFKDKLVEAAVLTSGVARADWDRHYERDLKEVPWDMLIVAGQAVSPRDYLIHLSENVFKKVIGVDVFGKAAVEEIDSKRDRATKSVFVFSDSGFLEELWPVVKTVSSCWLARIHREGKTFDGDSRDYIYPHFLADKYQKDFKNDATIEQCAEEIWEWSQNSSAVGG